MKNSIHELVRRTDGRDIAKLGLILMMGVSMSACSDSWKEEVLLHDGSKIIVERTVERGGRHEIGQQPPYKYQSLIFIMPETKQEIVWEDKFSEDVGSANFLPMLLDISGGAAYLVAYPMGCLSYNKWGRPNPPYVIFKHEGKEWKRIPLQELPAEIKTPNLIFSMPDMKVKESGKRFMTVEMIGAIIAGYKQPEYKTILREPYQGAGGGCIKTDYYKGYGWLSPDWFTDQPSLEACLKVCSQKKIATEACPCSSLFKGEK
jgi:hypothetical protein